MSATVRPEPWLADPPPGYHFEARPDPDWRLEVGGTCRRPRCGQPAIAALNRGWVSYRTRPPRRRDSWWAYCAEHLYGHWIEDGQIMHWFLIEPGRNR